MCRCGLSRSRCCRRRTALRVAFSTVCGVNVPAHAGVDDATRIPLRAASACAAQQASRGRRGCRAARQRARAFGNVRPKLRDLERIRLLLLPLVVQRLQARLFGLLRRKASRLLSLRALQARRLGASAKRAELLRCIGPHAVNTGAKALRCCAGSLPLAELLLTKRGKLGGVLGALAV